MRESIGITRELRGINGYEEAHPAALLMKATYAESQIFTRLHWLQLAAVVRELGAQMRNARITHDYDRNAVLPSLLITSLLQPLLHIMHKED